MLSFLRSLFSTRILSLLVPDAILAFCCYILAAYWTGGADPSVFLLYDNGLLQIALVVAGVLVGLQLNKLYVQVGVRSKILLVQQLCLTLGVTFLLESLLTLCADSGIGAGAFHHDGWQCADPGYPAGLADLLQRSFLEEPGR